MPFHNFLDPFALPGPLQGAAVAIGNFDGVHRGHRAVIEAAKALAKNRPALAVTFEPHPRTVFRPEDPLFRLSPPVAKALLLERTGLSGLITFTFDRCFAEITAASFLKDLIVQRLRASAIAVGYDFHFGKRRQGTTQFLIEQGVRLSLDISVVAPLFDGDTAISSSAIRTHLQTGDIAAANRLLGHEWVVVGEVVHGDKRGRALGYPTANLRLEADCRLRHGIYAVRIRLEGKDHQGVASFGRRPMFDNGPPLLEVFIFDFDGDLYGRLLEVSFVGWIRPEERFETIEALIARMEEDARIARAMTSGLWGAEIRDILGWRAESSRV